MFRKTIPFGRIIPRFFFAKVQNLGINSENISGGTVTHAKGNARTRADEFAAHVVVCTSLTVSIDDLFVCPFGQEEGQGVVPMLAMASREPSVAPSRTQVQHVASGSCE